MTDRKEMEMTAIRKMLLAFRIANEMNQKQMALALGFSPQYICDMEGGRRLPSVRFINQLIHYSGRGPIGRTEWHRAAAQAHGWDV